MPRRVIEIGSGRSSLVISAAINLNSKGALGQKKCTYTIIDPYPWVTATNGLPGLTNLEKERVELVDVSFFEQLDENDVLFIDSGHTVKFGGDVNFLILEVLPRLKPGVLIHFHDINLPYAPPRVYYTNPAFRVFWTEEFLLQAFLVNNKHFEIMLAMNYLQSDHMDKFCEAFPRFNLAANWANSSSLWIRSKSTKV